MQIHKRLSPLVKRGYDLLLFKKSVFRIFVQTKFIVISQSSYRKHMRELAESEIFGKIAKM